MGSSVQTRRVAVAIYTIFLITSYAWAGSVPGAVTSISSDEPGNQTNDGDYMIEWSVFGTFYPGAEVAATLRTRLNNTGGWTMIDATPLFTVSSGISFVHTKTETGKGYGLHNYKMEAVVYDHGTSQYYFTTDHVDVNYPAPTDGTAEPPPVEVPADTVGSTSYNIDVDGSGDSIVSIPLRLITGVAGFKPELGLIYDSGRGVQRLEQSLPEDTLGYGWRLDGLSEIRRCVVGQASSATIQLNNSDSLCLDGMPLVLTGGSHLQVGATYRTQIESYRLIEIKGASGALWFEVRAPDGTTLEYGNGGDSRVDQNGGTDYQWSVNKATSADGNVIDYTYHFNPANGINYPLSIEYTDAEVTFEYLNRTDAAAVAIGSAQQTQSVFLHTINVEIENTMVREYRLFDEVVSGNRRLSKLQECGYDTSGTTETCLAPLEFDWITPSPTMAGVEILLYDVVDGLGANHSFVYGTVVQGGSNAFLFNERPFGNAAPPSDTQLLTGSNGAALRHVVTQLQRDNGLGGTHNTDYAYQEKGLESTRNWGFLGFYAQRIKDTQSGIVTYAQYRMDYPYLRQTASVLQYDDIYGSHSELLTHVETDYAQQSISHGSTSTDYPYAARNTQFVIEAGIQLGGIETTTDLSFSGGMVATMASTSVAANGISVASVPGSTWGDIASYTLTNIERTNEESITFLNRTSGGDWLVGFVENTRRENWVGPKVGAGLLQETEFTPHATSLRVADFTQFPGHADLELTSTYTYDTSGRRTDTEISGVNVPSRTTSVGNFDAERFPLNFTNAMNQQSTATGCDLRFGVYTNITDINNQSSSINRDPFGRVTSATKGGTTVTTTYMADTGVTVNGVTSVYRVQVDSTPTPRLRTYHDVLGRVIRSETEGFDGTLIFEDTWYDAQGRAFKQSLPYHSGGTAYYIEQTFDLRDRLDTVTRPDNSTTMATYTVSGDHVVLTVDETVTDKFGSTVGTQTRRSEFDILGQLVETTDAYGTAEAVITSYTYDANGNALTVTVDGGVDGTTVTTLEYDDAGNRKKLIGPDVGAITTTYTALGQIKTNKDNKLQLTTYNYDELGRLTSRVDVDGTSSWTWDSATNGKGLLQSRTNGNGFTETYAYNNLSRLESVTTSITPIGGSSSEDYVTTYTYDSHRRPVDTTYVGKYTITRTYNSYGYLSEIKNGSTVLQSFDSANAFGSPTQETYGNGVVTTRNFDPKTGRLEAITSVKGSTNIQDLDYTWRSNGTLESRFNTVGVESREESFTYDALNRVTAAETFINGSNTRDLNYQYDVLGNIESKTSTLSGDTDVTVYGYGAGNAGPHAVTSANINGIAHTLTYDSNGAITKYDRAGTTTLDKYIEYNAASQPTKIVVGTGLNDASPTAKDEFAYDPDGQRYSRKSTWKDGATTRTETVRYIGNVEYITYSNDPDQFLNTYKIRIGENVMYLESQVPNPQYNPQGQPPYNQLVWSVIELEYAHRDHLGGIEAVTDQLGNKLHQLAYEPYGSRKDSDWRSNIDTLELADILSNEFSVNLPAFPLGVQYHARVARGFTGHEHLDRTGFIHMNGRVYDPTLGRFLSPDPIIQASTYSQDWNRYSYGFNNPLTFTDPTGFTENDNTTENNNTIDEIIVRGRKTPRTPILIINPWSIHEQLTNRAIQYFAMYDAYLAELTRQLFSTVRTPSSELSGDGMSETGQEPEAACGQEERPWYASGGSARSHFSRNTENDQFFRSEGLYGRSDIMRDEILNAGQFGFKQASPSETAFHRNGPGNENNLKFTSKVANNESWWQRNFSNRYGRYEIIVRPNSNGTHTHVLDPSNMGTLNRGNNPITHTTRDILPYSMYGNTPCGGD